LFGLIPKKLLVLLVGEKMPSKSKAQKRFFGYQEGRIAKGEKPTVKMSKSQIDDFAKGSSKGLPERKTKRGK
jgi:hypothetical protein